MTLHQYKTILHNEFSDQINAEVFFELLRIQESSFELSLLIPFLEIPNKYNIYSSYKDIQDCTSLNMSFENFEKIIIKLLNKKFKFQYISSDGTEIITRNINFVTKYEKEMIKGEEILKIYFDPKFLEIYMNMIFIPLKKSE